MDISLLIAAIGTLSGVILYLYRRIESNHAIAIQALEEQLREAKEELRKPHLKDTPEGYI